MKSLILGAIAVCASWALRMESHARIVPGSECDCAPTQDCEIVYNELFRREFKNCVVRAVGTNDSPVNVNDIENIDKAFD